MSLPAFFGTLNLILLSRLWLTFKDDGAELKTILKIGLLPLLSLAFVEMGTPWFLLLLTLLISPLILFFTEKRKTKIYRNRAWTLLFYLIVLSLIFGFFTETGLNETITGFIHESPFIGFEELLGIQIYLFGGLLVMNEMNIVLRYLMFALNLAPIGKQKNQSNITDQQYNTGRVIGMLERIFIYAFSLAGQFTAIGFILTAKAVVRYHDFVDDRAFAEYVLIGTLLSALLAMAIALFVSTLI